MKRKDDTVFYINGEYCQFMTKEEANKSIFWKNSVILKIIFINLQDVED